MGNLIQNQSTMTLYQRLKASKNKPAIALDVSASMDGIVEGTTRAIDCLRQVIKDIQVSANYYWFNTDWGKCTKENVPEPDGGTWLSPVIEAIKSDGYNEALVITDGDVNANNQEQTLKATENIKLTIYYVGPGKRPEFLEKLAKQSGGFCEKRDLKFTQELTEAIQKLLPPAGPISL